MLIHEKSTKKWLVLLWALVALCVIPTSASSQDYPSLSTPPQMEQIGENDAAVIVGIEYYFVLPDVAGVRETVNDWETFLVRGLGIPATRVHTLVDSRATKERMLTFAERAAQDVGDGGKLWFVFIGHGAPTADGKDGVLVGVDAQSDPASLEGRGLRRSELVQALEQGSQAETLVIIDACFSGQSSEGKALAEGMQPVVPDRVAEEFRPASSTMVMAAAESDQFAGALPGMQRPAFSYVLLGALRGWATGGGEVRASDALQYTRQHLRLLDHEQTPAFVGDDQVVLVRGTSEPEPHLASLMRAALRGPEPAERPSAPQVPEEISDPAVLHVVDVEPSPASLFVDGEQVGLAPGQFVVPSGRSVTVRIESPGHSAYESTMEIEAGELEQLRGVRLTALPAKLSVEANVHGAEILIDGNVVGQTVLGRAVEVETPATGRELSVQLEGYRTERRDLELSPGSREKVNVEMEVGPAETMPEGYVEIPSGTFMQGSPTNEEGRSAFQGVEQQRRVTISRGFWLKATPVTQGEWREVMGNNPSGFSSCGSSCPVEQVNWYETVTYLNRLSEREGLETCYEISGCTGTIGEGCPSKWGSCEGYQCRTVDFKGLDCEGYRLPTEAEWEYAARAGTTGARYGNLDQIAWLRGSAGNQTQPVGQKTPNEWGLYDMIGNVEEWTGDWHYSFEYEKGSAIDPTGTFSARHPDKTVRGCSWNGFESNCRAAHRTSADPADRRSQRGFRAARTIPCDESCEEERQRLRAAAMPPQSSGGCASSSSSGFILFFLLGLGSTFGRRWTAHSNLARGKSRDKRT